MVIELGSILKIGGSILAFAIVLWIAFVGFRENTKIHDTKNGKSSSSSSSSNASQGSTTNNSSSNDSKG